MNYHVRLRVLLTALILAAGVPARAAPSEVALVTDVAGMAELGAASPRRTLALLAVLRTDDTLRLADGARVVVAYPAAGPVFELKGPGVYRVAEQGIVATSGAMNRSELAAPLRALKIDPKRAVQASLVMRGVDGRALTAAAPVGRQLEAHARTLKWQPTLTVPETNWSYEVALVDDDGKVVFRATTRDSEITLPADLQLRRNEPYVWTVTAEGRYGRRAEAAAEFTLVDSNVERLLLGAQAAAAESRSNEAVYLLALRQHGLAQAAEIWAKRLRP